MEDKNDQLKMKVSELNTCLAWLEKSSDRIKGNFFVLVLCSNSSGGMSYTYDNVNLYFFVCIYLSSLFFLT